MDSQQKIVTYTNSQLRPFIELVKMQYEDSKKVNIPYSVWSERFLNQAFSQPSRFKLETYKEGELVRYVTSKSLASQYKELEPTIIKMKEEALDDPKLREDLSIRIETYLKENLKPDKEFIYSGVEYLDDEQKIPIWFGRTVKDIKLFVGPEELDLTKPYCLSIGDDNVHTNFQGITGAGKTVLAHELIYNLLLLYPPWELDLIIIDHKMSEMHVYGANVKTPHCKVIAITNAKEYILDLFEYIAEENTRRQELFSALGVNGVKALRNTYNFVMPSILLIQDELAYQLTVIEGTARQGNDNVSEEKKSLFSAMLKVATQGRNAKVHMAISSQDLGDRLDPEVSQQIGSGIVLKGGDKIARGCIGNTDVTRIDRKGLCICNPDRKSSDNERLNTLVGVPFLNMDIPKDRPMSPVDILLRLTKVSNKYNFHKEMDYYDATVLIPSREFESELETCKNKVNKDSYIYQCIVPVGKQISYRNPCIIRCEMTYKAGDGFIIDSYNENTLRYMFNVILRSVHYQLSERGLKTQIYTTTDQTYNTLALEKLVGIDYNKVKEFPIKELKLYKTRSSLLRLDQWLVNNQNTDKVTIFKYVLALLGKNTGINDKDIEQFLEGLENESKEKEAFLKSGMNFLSLYEKQSTSGTRDENGYLHPSTFEPRLVYWFDIQDCEDVKGREKLAQIADFFKNGAKVGFINVLNFSTWSEENFIDAMSGVCRHVLEYSTIATFKALRLGMYTANVNQDSLVVHDRLKKGTYYYLKNFGGV